MQFVIVCWSGVAQSHQSIPFSAQLYAALWLTYPNEHMFVYASDEAYRAKAMPKTPPRHGTPPSRILWWNQTRVRHTHTLTPDIHRSKHNCANRIFLTFQRISELDLSDFGFDARNLCRRARVWSIWLLSGVQIDQAMWLEGIVCVRKIVQRLTIVYIV